MFILCTKNRCRIDAGAASDNQCCEITAGNIFSAKLLSNISNDNSNIIINDLNTSGRLTEISNVFGLASFFLLLCFSLSLNIK